VSVRERKREKGKNGRRERSANVFLAVTVREEN